MCKEYAILTLATLVMSAGTYNFIINMALLVLGFLFLGERLWRKDGVYQRSDVCGIVCGRKAVFPCPDR